MKTIQSSFLVISLLPSKDPSGPVYRTNQLSFKVNRYSGKDSMYVKHNYIQFNSDCLTLYIPNFIHDFFYLMYNF